MNYVDRVGQLAERADSFLHIAEPAPPATANRAFERLEGLFYGMKALRDELRKLHTDMFTETGSGARER